MTDYERPLEFPNEVEGAVIMSGRADMQLALGAGLVADPNRYRYAFAYEATEPKKRLIVGVCALAIDYDGTSSFRTATFGIKNADGIREIDAIATSQLIGIGVASDRYPTATAVVNNSIMVQGMYELTREGSISTVGGAFYFMNEANKVSMRYFISEKFAGTHEEINDRRSTKIVGGIASIISPAIRNARRKSKENRALALERGEQVGRDTLGLFSMLAGRAVKRPGGPVIVDRPFVANIRG